MKSGKPGTPGTPGSVYPGSTIYPSSTAYPTTTFTQKPNYQSVKPSSQGFPSSSYPGSPGIKIILLKYILHQQKIDFFLKVYITVMYFI